MHDDKILGVESHIERQIDVSIRTTIAGHEILVIVQAKHLSRPADVNVVGEFKAVIEDVRASKGVLVCSSGFTEAALVYGRVSSIDLCTAVDAQNRQWNIDIKIPLVWVEVQGEVEVDLELTPDKTNEKELVVARDIAKWKLSKDLGLSSITVGQYLADLWNSGIIDRVPNVDHVYVMADKDFRLLFGDDFWCPITDLSVHYKTTKLGWLGAFTLRDCRGLFDQVKKTLIAKAVISSSELPFARDPSWPKLEDPEKYFQSNIIWIMIEKKEMGEESFTFTHVTGLM